MKKSIFTLALTVFAAGTVFTSCNTPSEKVENAENNVMKANQNLDKANEEYLEDMDKYKKETTEKIAANEQSIDEFKARIEYEKKDARADYKKKIAELEHKNTDMKKKMDDYKAEGKEKWESFKTEFSHDMDELGKAFKDLTVKNTK